MILAYLILSIDLPSFNVVNFPLVLYYVELSIMIELLSIDFDIVFLDQYS